MQILLCGHASFAAQGLREMLAARGWDVVCFGRGKPGRDADVVSGPINGLLDNPDLRGRFDTVINYILLKDQGMAENDAYMAALLEFCAQREVKHLIHISSISSYEASVRTITEDAPLEQRPERKGSYGSLKSATDLYLLKNCPPGLRLSLVRPGFILAPGLGSPIVGTAARLPWGKLLVIGNGASEIPVTTRDVVNEAVAKLVADPPKQAVENLILVSPESPTRVEYLTACCAELGCGDGVTRMPAAAWWLLAAGGEAVARVIGQKKLQVYQKLTARLPRQHYDPRATEKRLGMDLRVDWRAALRASLPGQSPQTALPAPYAPRPIKAVSKGITYIGFGRIVRQKHLPALRRMDMQKGLLAYDLNAGLTAEGQTILPIAGATIAPADLFVVATPGPAHIGAVDLLSGIAGRVLVEKPLAYNGPELERWMAFAAARPDAVAACHNYRFKSNVQEMLRCLSAFNPGALRSAQVVLDSLPVANESAVWLRDERRARTLLMDYGIHFLDVACIFDCVGWRLGQVRYDLDQRGHTSIIDGTLRSAGYDVHLLLRQGFFPRRTRVFLTFQNYSVSLGFFPDTFAVYMSNDNPWLYRREAKVSMRATIAKVRDKVTGRDRDLSHQHVIAAMSSADDHAADQIKVGRLAAFYRGLFELAEAVYGANARPASDWPINDSADEPPKVFPGRAS